CALLLLAFLGFGTLLGAVAGAPVKDTLAASRRPLKVAVAQSGGPAAGSNEAPPTAGSSGEAPLARASSVQEEATPAPSSPTPAAAPAPSPPKTSTPSAAPLQNEGSGASGTSPRPSSLPPVRHIFVVMLSEQPYAALFGPSSQSPYLSRTLERKGELLVRYYAVAHQGMANGVALISGQGPTAQTAANCPLYSDIVAARTLADEQVGGEGCVYPPAVKTLAGQLTARRLSWRAYVQRSASPAGSTCPHPGPGQPDAQGSLAPAWRDPFLYFHAIIDSGTCARDDVGLDALAGDLAGGHAPNFAYIVPDRCHDASPAPCRPGAPAGPAATEPFLRDVVPEILGSRAYRHGGLLVITADQAPSAGELADSSSCCRQPVFPNVPDAARAGLAPDGGGQVGALLLSPFIKPGTTSLEPANHFSLLRTVEDLFGLSHLGYASA